MNPQRRNPLDSLVRLSNRLKRVAAATALDLKPVKEAPKFRWLIAGRSATLFGAQATAIALLVQLRDLTHSALAVGTLGAVEIPPVIIFALYGGHLADRVDRRKVLLTTEAALALVTLGLLANSSSSRPFTVVLYGAAAMTMALAATQRPALDASVPQLVNHKQLTAASTLISLSTSGGFILGSAAGGTMIASFGPSAAYALDLCSYGVSLVCLSRVGTLRRDNPAQNDAEEEQHDFVAGLRYVIGRPDLLGSYLVDLAAMSLAFPESLFPFMTSTLHAKWALGLMFAMVAIGAGAASITSGWLTHVRRYGIAIAIAGGTWGVATAAFGLSPNITTALIALTIAGAADFYSGVFRDTLWNESISPTIRGRVAGIEVISYGLGPAIGQLRAGAIADATNARFALASGGALCLLAIAAVSLRLRAFRNYRTPSSPD